MSPYLKRQVLLLGVPAVLLMAFAAVLYLMERASDPEVGLPAEEPISGIDLLGLVEPAKDAVKGSFQLLSRKLVTPGQEAFACTVVPYVPPEEYDLTLVVQRKGGTNCLVLGLPVAGKPATLVLDGAGPDRSDVSGIDALGGGSFFDNDSTYDGAVLLSNRRNVVVCAVRKTGLLVTVGGKTVIDWQGDWKKVGVNQEYKTPASEALSLGSYHSEFHVSRLQLKAVTGAGRPLRP